MSPRVATTLIQAFLVVSIVALITVAVWADRQQGRRFHHYLADMARTREQRRREHMR